MALEDKLKTLEAESKEKKEQVEKETEEKNLAPIRQKITDLGEKRERTSSQLELLASEYEEGKEKIEEFKGKDTEVSRLFETYEDALKGAGIETKGEFISKPEYAEEKEVAELKEARAGGREKVEEIAKIKEELKKEFPDLELSFVAKDREKDFDAVRGEIEKIDDQIEQQMIQTPEGREAIKEKLLEEFSKTKQTRVSYSIAPPGPEGIKVRISSTDLVDREDLSKAEKYGEDFVKDAVKEHYNKGLDKLYEGHKGKLGVVEKEVERMKNLPEKSREAEEKLTALVEKKRKALEEITQLRESDEDLNRAIRKYGFSRPDELLNLYLLSDKAPEAVLERFRTLSESDLDSVVLGRKLNVFDPEDLIGYVERSEKFIDKALDLVRKKDSELFPDTYSGLSSKEDRPDFYNIEFDRDALEYMKGKDSFQEVEESLENELKTFNNEAQAIKERASDQVEMDWLKEKLPKMHENEETEFSDIYSLEIAYEDSQSDKELSEKALVDIASFRVKHSDKLDENISEGRIIDSVVEKLDEVAEGRRKALEEINILNTEISRKERNKPAMFGKKKWEEELAELKGSLQERKEESERFKEDQLKYGNERLLDEYGTSLDYIHDSESSKAIKEILTQESVKLSTLLDQLEGVIKEIQEKKLPPKEKEMIEKYREIKKRMEEK